MGIFPKRRNREKIILNRINYVLNLRKTKDGLILDDGTGSGKTAIGLGERGFVVGIDQRPNFPNQKSHYESTQFINAVGEFLPFKSETFHAIISQMVLEHVSDVQRYLQEMFNVLKRKGIVYLAIPNRMFPIEPHTKIPLISYLPHYLFQKIVNLKIGRIYPLKYLNYKILKGISAIGFKKIRDPVPFFLKNRTQFYPRVPLFVCRFLVRTYQIMRFFIPTWIWLLQKS